MSLSAPGPGGPPPGGPPPGPPGPPPGPGGPPPGPGGPPPGPNDGEGDPRDLHDLAVDCVTDIQKLGIGLAHAGATPNVVSSLTQMADKLSLVVKILASGPGVNPNAQHEAATQGGPPPGGPPHAEPPHPGGGPPPPAEHAPAPGGPPPGPGPEAPPPPRSIHEATQQLHHAAIAAATERMRAPVK